MKNISRNKNQTYKEAGKAALFILPSLLGCFLFIIIPSILSFLLSFTNWNLISPIKFTWFDNYIELLFSREFWFILKNTIFYAVFVTIFATLLPLILASVLNNKILSRLLQKLTTICSKSTAAERKSQFLSSRALCARLPLTTR